MRYLLVLIALTSLARADVLDAKAFAKKIEGCAAADGIATVGAIEKVETIGKRPSTKIVQVTGKKARGYVVFEQDVCFVIPVVGKPAAFVKGNFGNGATNAYALRGAACAETCATVVSLKTKDDALVDVMPLPDDCEDALSMQKRALFTGRDSIELACFSSGGADVGRSDALIDAGSGELQTLLLSSAGIAWVQIRDTGPRCTARHPGGLKVVTVGAKPEVDVSTPATPEEAEAAKVEWTAGGCDQIVTTRRFAFDGKKLVPKPGKPRTRLVKGLCGKCKPQD